MIRKLDFKRLMIPVGFFSFNRFIYLHRVTSGVENLCEGLTLSVSFFNCTYWLVLPFPCRSY